jgi:oxygen-dependent protoporphyrinogen oxidase
VRGLLTGAGLGVRGRLDLVRLLASAALRRREFDPDRPESTPLGATTIGQLAARYHPDLGDYLLTPVVSAFFGWNPERSAAAPLVSLLLAVGPVRTWRTYRDGMDTLARRLAERVDVVTGRPVREVAADGGRARVVTDDGEVSAGTAVLCVPAPEALRLHPGAAGAERHYLAACGFSPMLKVSCLLDRPLRPRTGRRLYALLVPDGQGPGAPVLGGLIVDHAKHAGRVPAGRGLITLLAAPAAIPELMDAPDGEAVRLLTGAAEPFVPDLAAATTATFVHRFRHGLPEATPAALALRPAFLRRPLGPVDYAGDWVQLRPSSEGAVRSAALAAARVRARHGAVPAIRGLPAGEPA